MPSDIVERLRIWDDPGETICREAAAEIERLRQLNSDLAPSVAARMEMAAEIGRLQRELNAAITAKGSCELEIERLEAEIIRADEAGSIARGALRETK